MSEGNLIKEIEEALYHWRREGWEVAKVEDDRYTLVHARARPVICGARTPFRNVGAIQGEMRRAFVDGPRLAQSTAVYPSPATEPAKKHKKKHKKRTGENHFSFDEPQRPARFRPAQPYRRRPGVVVQEGPRAEPFANAAWELAKLRLMHRGLGNETIDKVHERYLADADYRATLIEIYRHTPTETIEALRQAVLDQG
jgi:hypothetical protein